MALPSLPGFHPLLDTAVRRVVDGEALESFCDWFSQEMGALIQADHPLPPNEVADGFRYQRHVARTLWAGLPVPHNHWRPRPLPKPERNSLCPCGSGRKFKQCCAEFAGVQPPGDLNSMYVLALSQATPAMLQPQQVREVPPEALAMAAAAWNQQHRPERTIEVLEPLFQPTDRLDHRHEIAFDMLMDALLMAGLEARRHALARHVAQARDKQLASAARCRLVSMLADHGDTRGAWALFQEAQRLMPQDPQLWHLELTLLHAEGRADEARMRSTVLAARARKAGMHELAETLLHIGTHGLASQHTWANQDENLDDEEDAAWVALCALAPNDVDAAACRALYQIKHYPASEPGVPPTLSIKPQRKLAALERRWSRRFGASKPMLTGLQGEAWNVLDQLPEATQFLREHREAWVSVEVLDDLLLAAAETADIHEAPTPVIRGAQRLADQAVRVLRALVGSEAVRLEWPDLASRPALRVLAQATHLAWQLRDEARFEQLASWSLQLNPRDNHGWRFVLAPQLLNQARHAEALALLERYPEDAPPMRHHQALALFGLGRREEAEAMLRSAHAEAPRYVQALLPDTMDAPPAPDGPGFTPGSEYHAWEVRMAIRAAWVRSGALEWLGGLDLNAPKRRAPRKTPASPKPGAPASAKKASAGVLPTVPAFTKKDESRLRKNFPDYARLHGLLTAVAWHPGLVTPTHWLHAAMSMRGKPSSVIKTLQADMDALVSLYNSACKDVLTTPPTEPPPLAQVLGMLAPPSGNAFAWAAGFVQGAEIDKSGWRDAGHPVSTTKGAFAGLYRLAARAAGTPDGWRATQDAGQPLLLGIDEDLTPQAELELALTALWRGIAPLRQARAASSP